MKNLTNKEKELFTRWKEIFGNGPEYDKKVDQYFEEKKKIEEFLKGKEGESK